jgi:hypothetical protein
VYVRYIFNEPQRHRERRERRKEERREQGVIYAEFF